ncbi:MAG: hypothetical protein J6S14_21965 [Clostridia bacterium]|nr:hypothetical protein [Clostridia bacterium]
MISFYDIYDRIERELNRESRPMNCTSYYEPVPSEFPTVMVSEMEHHQAKGAIDLAFTDDQLERYIEVQVVSNKWDGAPEEARSIMAEVEAVMKRLYFIETFCGEIENIDPAVTRMSARFHRVFGGLDTLPT